MVYLKNIFPTRWRSWHSVSVTGFNFYKMQMSHYTIKVVDRLRNGQNFEIHSRPKALVFVCLLVPRPHAKTSIRRLEASTKIKTTRMPNTCGRGQPYSCIDIPTQCIILM